MNPTLDPDWTLDRSALQRYVIAWAERQRAVETAARAARQMRAEAPAATRTVAQERGVLLRVELLDGSRYDVGHDGGGIFVMRAADEAWSGLTERNHA